MAEIRSVCVYCASSSRGPESHRDAARRLGTTLAENNVRLIFGGGRVGLMGVTADAALAAGGEVIGVIPHFLQELELGHDGCDELMITDSMHSRKQRMAELADGFAILPGGIGTLDEAFEIITWRQLGRHDKPIILVDIEDYWSPFHALMDHIVDHNYMHGHDNTLFGVVSGVDEVLPALRAAPPSTQPFESKWL
ncbi:MAG: TIGR00730 family Rossman fold protein [Alphaproteobacteria bacterium]|nr:TIGR00730 family Rossman fold protein [Alphaproteobacteria bacterium]